MKYCSIIWFTAERLPDPATDHTLFTSAPIVHGPGCVKATTEGPMLSFPCPSTLLVAVGSTNAGPAPRIILAVFPGVGKKVGFISPSPDPPAEFSNASIAKNGGGSATIP